MEIFWRAAKRIQHSMARSRSSLKNTPANFLLVLFVCSILTNVNADTQKRGSARITYKENSSRRWTDPLNSPPLIVGGVGRFASQLYYPPNLRHLSHPVQGSTRVVVRVNKSGRVTSVIFSPRLHPDLETIVIEAIYACQWLPAKKHGVPVNGGVRIPVSFSLSRN